MLRLFLNVNDPLRAEPRTPRYPTVELERTSYAVVTPSVPAHTHTHTLRTAHCTAGTQPGEPSAGRSEKGINQTRLVEPPNPSWWEEW